MRKFRVLFFLAVASMATTGAQVLATCYMPTTSCNCSAPQIVNYQPSSLRC